MEEKRKEFWQQIDALLDIAITEDLGEGDATSRSLFNEGEICTASFAARENGILAGMEVIEHLYKRIDSKVNLTVLHTEGSSFAAGEVLAKISGPAISIISGERIALNILQRMCGVATVTHRYVKAAAGTKAKICDTRKTIPGWRVLDKLAVYLGGGTNHRQGLYDMMLIKDNHIAIAGRHNTEASAAWAVRTARNSNTLPIEVEVDTIEQLTEVLPEEPEMVLLDNMSPAVLSEAVKLTSNICQEQGLRRPQLEASGGIELADIPDVARSGVDRISVGALTHSVRALDIGLDMED